MLIYFLQDREATRSEGEPKTPVASATTVAPSKEDEDLEKYSKFFASLTKKSGGSATNSPRSARQTNS